MTKSKDEDIGETIRKKLGVKKTKLLSIYILEAIGAAVYKKK